MRRTKCHTISYTNYHISGVKRALNVHEEMTHLHEQVLRRSRTGRQLITADQCVKAVIGLIKTINVCNLFKF